MCAATGTDMRGPAWKLEKRTHSPYDANEQALQPRLIAAYSQDLHFSSCVICARPVVKGEGARNAASSSRSSGATIIGARQVIGTHMQCSTPCHWSFRSQAQLRRDLRNSYHTIPIQAHSATSQTPAAQTSTSTGSYGRRLCRFSISSGAMYTCGGDKQRTA